MLLGYVVYLCIALCTGELVENVIDFVGIYFPEYQDVFAAMIPAYLRANKRKQYDHRSTVGGDRATSLSRKTSLSLFDDLKKNGEQHEHIVGADMAMADGHAPHHPDDTLAAPTTNKDIFVDFTMEFRKTTTDEHANDGFAM